MSKDTFEDNFFRIRQSLGKSSFLWFVPVFVLIFPAFAACSWFKSQDLQSMVSSDNHEKTPFQDLRPELFVNIKDIYAGAGLLQKQGKPVRSVER